MKPFRSLKFRTGRVSGVHSPSPVRPWRSQGMANLPASLAFLEEQQTVLAVDSQRGMPQDRLHAPGRLGNGHRPALGTLDNGACRADSRFAESVIAHNSLIRSRLPSTTLSGYEPVYYVVNSSRDISVPYTRVRVCDAARTIGPSDLPIRRPTCSVSPAAGR